jgi:predicted NBD/HSP70 family sugar kinase
MGRLNKRALLDRLQRLGTASRAGLAKSLGLSQPTAGKIVDQLIEMGVIEEVEVSEPDGAAGKLSRVGRPARMLRLDRNTPRFLGIQLGVSETSVAPLPVGVVSEDQWSLQVPTPDSAEAWRQQLAEIAGRLPQKTFWGVLVSVPGLVDEKQGRVLFSPNLHWTERTEVTRLIQGVWNAPVILLQEERALALGHQAGDPAHEGFLLVDFGEGVGGTIVVDGKLYTNPLPLSGEVGHTPVRGNNRNCGCGATGCLETLVSIRGLLQSFSEETGQSPAWPALASHIAEIGVAPWLAETLEATATVIAGALNVVGLRRVILTGTMNELPPTVIRFLAGAISRGAMWGRFGQIEIEGAPRRRMAGLVSAAIDRLVVPMVDLEPPQSARPRLAVVE